MNSYEKEVKKLIDEWYEMWCDDCILSFDCENCKFHFDNICNNLGRAEAKLLKFLG